MTVAVPSLVQSIDVYLPDGSGERLVLQNDDLSSIGPDEGAIGRAWRASKPTIETHDDGLAVVATPCLQGDACRGVLAFRCDTTAEARGAFEVWTRNERGELGLSESLYIGLERLARISPCVKFPKRAGLPGRVWDDRFPRVLGSLQDSKQFIRVAAARSEQLASAVGVPFMRRPPELDAVLLVLNSEHTPIAKAMEVWARDLSTERLHIVSADYGDCRALASVSRRTTLRTGEGLAGRVFADGAPHMTHDLLGREFPRGECFVEHGFQQGVGIPVHVGTDLVACVNLYL